MDANYDQLIARRGLVTKIIWGAMFFQPVMLFVVLFVLTGNVSETSVPFSQAMANQESLLFIAIAAVLAAASYFIYDFMMSKMLNKRMNREHIISRMENARGRYGHKVYSEQEINFVRSLDDGRLFNFWIITSSMPLHIIRFALCEAVALIGFVLAIQNHNAQLYIPFALVSIVLLFTYFPKYPSRTEIR